MSLKKLLAQKVEVKDIPIHHGDMTFIVRGKPDGTLLTKYSLDQKDFDLQLRHCEKNIGKKIDRGSFSQMFLVKECLVNDEVVENGRYEISEIAKLAVEHGPLYLQILHATMEVLGLVSAVEDDPDDNVDLIADQSLGK
jgi:hypothetical protein